MTSRDAEQIIADALRATVGVSTEAWAERIAADLRAEGYLPGSVGATCMIKNVTIGYEGRPTDNGRLVTKHALTWRVPMPMMDRRGELRNDGTLAGQITKIERVELGKWNRLVATLEPLDDQTPGDWAGGVGFSLIDTERDPESPGELVAGRLIEVFLTDRPAWVDAQIVKP